MIRTLLLICVLGMVGCSEEGATNGCKNNSDCGAGEICSDRDCRALCQRDDDCGAGKICVNAVCTLGHRSEPPTITAINGNSPDADIFWDGLVISGMHLSGVSVALGPNELEIRSSTDTEVEALLPLAISPGDYVLRVSNGVDSDQGDVRILRGEPGDPKTASEVLTMLQSLGTPVPELDADLVDGHHATDFALAADAVDTAMLQNVHFKNLARNGSFERWPSGESTWPMGWAEYGAQGTGTITAITSAWVDARALRIEDSDLSGTVAGELMVYTSVPASLHGADITVTIWARREAGLAVGSIGVADAGEVGSETSITTGALPTADTWTRVRLTHTLSSSPEYLKVILRPADSDAAAYDFDGLMVTAGTLAPDYFLAHEFDSAGQSLVAYYHSFSAGQNITVTSDTPVQTNRAVSYDKRYDDSLLKLTYNDNLRTYVSPNAGRSCSWHIYVDGEPCADPGVLVGAVYTPQTTVTNPHRQRSIIGVCRGIASGPITAGPHEVRVYVGRTPHYDNADCYSGWSSTSTLLVEELP